MAVGLSQEELLIINLLLRIAVMAGIASLVLGFRFVSDFLMRGTASPAARIRLAATLASVFIVGVVVLLVATAMQVARVDTFYPLDHDGLYHVIAMAGAPFLYWGGQRLKVT